MIFSNFLSISICTLSNSNYCIIQLTLQYITVRLSQKHPVLSNFQLRVLLSTRLIQLLLHLLLSLRQHQDLCLCASTKAWCFKSLHRSSNPPRNTSMYLFSILLPLHLYATYLKNTNETLYNNVRHSKQSTPLWLQRCGYEFLLRSCAKICCCSLHLELSPPPRLAVEQTRHLRCPGCGAVGWRRGCPGTRVSWGPSGVCTRLSLQDQSL